MADIPLMTEEGSFIFNGIERVVVSQIVRSPSVYITRDGDISTTKGQIIPTRGMWLEFEQGANDVIRVVLDRSSKVTIGIFLKCFGYTNEEILKLFGDNKYIKKILEREPQTTQEEALIELSRKTRPTEIPSAESTRSYLNLFFFRSIL